MTVNATHSSRADNGEKKETKPNYVEHKKQQQQQQKETVDLEAHCMLNSVTLDLA